MKTKNHGLLFLLLVAWATTFSCISKVAGENRITLRVRKGQTIKLSFKADAPGQPMRVLCGRIDTTFLADDSKSGTQCELPARASTMTVYGDIVEFDCGDNYVPSKDWEYGDYRLMLKAGGYEPNIYAVDISDNAVLKRLSCEHNKLPTLDLSHNPALECLNCYGNNLTALDLSHNPALKWLSCHGNSLSALDLSRNPALTDLYCSGNSLTRLDLSRNPALTDLDCTENELTRLDVSHNPELKSLACDRSNLPALDLSHNPKLQVLYCWYGELMTPEVLDRLYCKLPDRSGQEEAGSLILFDDPPGKEGLELLSKTTGGNAQRRGWKICYSNRFGAWFDASEKIEAYHGTHVCE